MARATALPALRHSFRQCTLDPFQAEALYHIDCGNSILLAAPTGTGKTLVADYLVEKVLAAGGRVAYTAPVKALANQKYRGFVKFLGAGRVGILTGDVAENAAAPIVVMTTEILRNLLALGEDPAFSWAIFDEIHYLDHRERGNVWEQALSFLPAGTRILGLSATVPNAEEIAAWIGRVLGRPVSLIRHGLRAVPLRHYYFNGSAGLIEPDQLLIRQAEAVLGPGGAVDIKAGLPGAVDVVPPSPAARACRDATSHMELVSFLAKNRLFPCLYFVFSRRGCEEHARQLAAKADYLGPREKDGVRVAARNALAESDLAAADIPGYAAWREMWLRGVAAHHAGMLPVLKEIVELLLERKLLRVVYATETFAVGVNLPVRTVCFDSLYKFDGQGFRYLTQQEYFQMAGRAGRRGLDTRGIVIALADFANLHKNPPPAWDEAMLSPIQSRFFLPDHVLLDLVHRLDEDGWEEFLRRSLAVFQGADPAVLARRCQDRLDLLRQLDYLDDRGLRPRGEVARHIFQREVPVTELIFDGALAEIPPEHLAGLAAALVDEERSGELAYTYRPPAWLGRVEASLARAAAVLSSGGQEPARWLDPAAIEPVVSWCSGTPLVEVLNKYPQDPGDFVARCRRAIDLLRQLGGVSPEIRPRAAEAVRLLDRGLVRVRL